MKSQKVNRYSRKTARHGAALFRMAALSPQPVRDDQTGFIQHPMSFPMELRRLWFGWHKPLITNSGSFGVLFVSEKYLKPGTNLEVEIPLRNEIVKYRGRVVLVRNQGRYFEIGLWPFQDEDASRARIVEQICHIETYLQEKKYREGPYCINRDQAASEWISKYAGTVPS